MKDVDGVAGFEAVVVGSGPIGSPPRPDDAHAVDVAELELQA